MSNLLTDQQVKFNLARFDKPVAKFLLESHIYAQANRIAELELVLIEARDHLYSKQDMDRVRDAARRALEGK